MRFMRMRCDGAKLRENLCSFPIEFDTTCSVAKNFSFLPILLFYSFDGINFKQRIMSNLIVNYKVIRKVDTYNLHDLFH